MDTILNIETSGNICSAALTADGMVLCHHEDDGGRNHASMLSGFVKSCLDYARDHGLKPDAVAVSMGPGSYTGLRIGLSEAKGLAYALNIPLIGIETLKLMAVTAMFEADMPHEDTVFIPMVDARRMEVFTAAYDLSLNTLMEPQALILEDCPYSALKETGRPLAFFGSGAEKARTVFADCPQAVFVPHIEPLASGMTALADLAFNRRDFVDTAYCTPIYIKDFQATKPKHLL